MSSIPRAFANQRRSRRGQRHQLWLPENFIIFSDQVRNLVSLVLSSSPRIPRIPRLGILSSLLIRFEISSIRLLKFYIRWSLIDPRLFSLQSSETLIDFGFSMIWLNFLTQLPELKLNFLTHPRLTCHSF